MKRSIFLAAILAVSIAASAAVVTPERAMQVAQSFVPVQKTSKKNAPGVAATPTSQIVYTHYMPKSGRPAIYVVNIGNAFAIVSADDVAHPILGYNYSKSWPTDGNIPPQVKSFFDDLAAQMEAATEQPQDREIATEWRNPRMKKAKILTKTNNLPDSVGPLLTTTWDQGQYYNALCPEDPNGPDGHVLTGCVATAMAQIINYWGKQGSIHTRGAHSYQSNYGELTVNYDTTTYDFAHMPDELTSISTPQEINAVAKLMYHCGVGVNMGYRPNESGAYNQEARAALINYFKISPDASFAEKINFTNAEWENMLRANLAIGIPIYYCGRNEFGEGHAFVCNGYQKEGFFYFNFGWSGSADGWYLTNAAIGYTSNQAAILNIVPDINSNIILCQIQGGSTFVVDEPLELYHLMGHNSYLGTDYIDCCTNNINFVSAYETNQLIVDIVEFEDQSIDIYDESDPNNQLRSLTGNISNNDLSPIISLTNSISCSYVGHLFYSGFKLCISQNDICRMVSNTAISVDTTTIHLMWQENGGANQWQVEYGEEGFAHGEGTLLTLNDTNVNITSLKKLTKYDFYIRSVCGDNQYGSWLKKTISSEAPYWQDIVTTQPASYVINDSNFAIISTPEDFVWYTKAYHERAGAIFSCNIDMKGYKWRPTSPGRYIDGKGYKLLNIYINEPNQNHVAIFTACTNSLIKNLGIEKAYISGSSTVAGMCAVLNTDGHIANCYVSNSTINGYYNVGGICANVYGGILQNSYVNVVINSPNLGGLLTSELGNASIINCYAAGSVRLHTNCYYAGIVAFATGGTIRNCYSINLPMGVIGNKGGEFVTDTSSFYIQNNVPILRTPIAFEEGIESSLLGALNKGVIQLNDSINRLWTFDTELKNDGLPVLGDYYVVSCPNSISNLQVKNIIKEGKNGVEVKWSDDGIAEEWEIKYQPINSPIDSIVRCIVTDTIDTLYNLTLDKIYIFSVRSKCNAEHHSGWTTIKARVDVPLWTDIVTERPEGYIEDENGNVIISSAEGLAWLSILVNGLHGNDCQNFVGKSISLVADIDLLGYRWYPIAEDMITSSFGGTFDGNNHFISNLYIVDFEYAGLFGTAGMSTSLCNIKLANGNISNASEAGGLLGCGRYLKEINNCSSNVSINNSFTSGSLCGTIWDLRNEHSSIVLNCYATGNVSSAGRFNGGLIGEVRGTRIQNCYATGNINGGDYRGGIIGCLDYNSVIINCYSAGRINFYDGPAVGLMAQSSTSSYIYSNGQNFICHQDTSNIQILTPPIIINDSIYNDLLGALNGWVNYTRDPNLKTWVKDTMNINNGFPILGENYEALCYAPENVSAANVTQLGDNIIKTRISWEQRGEISNWEIMYVSPTQSLDSGRIITTNTNPCEITILPVGTLLDIYVRSVYDENTKSNWSKPIRYIPDKLLWTAVLKSRPTGFTVIHDIEDYYEVYDIYISSAEGLAWLAIELNKLSTLPDQSELWQGIDNEQFCIRPNNEFFKIRNIFLTADVDISAYRWTPIKTTYLTMGYIMGEPSYYDADISVTFDGGGHTITGLYCNENESFQGLFRRVTSSTIKNTILKNCNVYGLNYCGGIAACADWSKIYNCMVNGIITGVENIGGVAGIHGNSIINNVAFIGKAATRIDVTLPNSNSGRVGGIVGYPADEYGGINNAYVAAEIEGVYSGLVAGSGSNPPCSNVYALSYPTSLSLTWNNTDQNSSFYTKNGNSCTLNTPPYINGAFRTDLVDALNAWVDANNSEGKYRHWVADTENVNGGFPIFDPTESPATGIETQTANANAKAIKILCNGQIFILRGDKVYTVTGQLVR